MQNRLTHIVVIFLLLFVLIVSPNAEKFEIAQIRYGGGGDWYGDQTAVSNWLRILKKRLGMNVSNQRVIVRLTDRGLYQYPFLYLVGHGNIQLSTAETKSLREYLNSGGFLFVNDDYGLDVSFRREIKKVFPKKQLKPIPNDHPIYHCFYDLKGLPKIHQHDGDPAQGFGLFHDGRLVVFYAYSSDIGDGLEDKKIHPDDPPHLRQQAARMAVNIITYVLTH
ncbi:MAG: DUF4159 domain-containing protein [Candidatus Poribacteria bacterium]|nr:DUF4159 domain-containing protein [Candidatus Poribacteria bacterium]